MKKFTFLMLPILIAALNAPAQTVQEKIDRQAKDPKTAENAAKADVYVSKNKSVFDSTTLQSSNEVKVKKDRKKKQCRKKN